MGVSRCQSCLGIQIWLGLLGALDSEPKTVKAHSASSPLFQEELPSPKVGAGRTSLGL